VLRQLFAFLTVNGRNVTTQEPSSPETSSIAGSPAANCIFEPQKHTIKRTLSMKPISGLLMILSLFAVALAVALPGPVQAHGGIGGYHGAVRPGGYAGVHGGINGVGFHAGVGDVGFGHVGYYPHFSPAVGFYHPAARATAWGAAYSGAYAYGGYNPYAYNPNAGVDVNNTSSEVQGTSGFGSSQAAENAQQKLEAELKKDNDKQ
jgi:hypothetical protein